MTIVADSMCAYTSDAEEILTFKTFKGFKKVALETDNNLTGINKSK
jgi:hypothetical protein